MSHNILQSAESAPRHLKVHYIFGVILAAAVLLFIRACLFVLLADAETRIQYVPDDTFYYLTLARNFVEFGQWTFDSGTSVTTGFHILHAYTLALFDLVLPFESESFVQFAVLLSLLWVSVSASIAIFLIWRIKQVVPLVLLTLFLLSRNVWLNAVSGTEWSLVLLMSALYCLAILRFQKWERSRSYLVFLVLGLLGSLARSDFGLLPAAVAVAAGLEFLVFRRRDFGGVALAGLAGAIGGVGLISLHNYVVAGNWASSSAGMKLAWLEVYGHSADRILDKTFQLFTGTLGSKRTLLTILSIMISIVGFYAYYCPKEKFKRPSLTPLRTEHSAFRVLWLASILATIGYIYLYSFVPMGVQHWYTANLVVPTFLCLVLPFASHQIPASIKLAVLSLLAILGERQVRTALEFAETPEWPHQVSMIRAGDYLADASLPAKVGSWNAGIIGYHAGGDVINLDGLVNQDIQTYIADDDLLSYVDSVGIGFIADFVIMVTADDLAERGGYVDGRLVSRLSPMTSFDEMEGRWKHLTLFRVDAEPPPPQGK